MDGDLGSTEPFLSPSPQITELSEKSDEILQAAQRKHGLCGAKMI